MAATSEPTQYYLVVNNEQQGPFTLDALKNQQLTPQSLVWTAGMENWLAASQVPTLATLFEQQPDPNVLPPIIANAVKKETPIAATTKLEEKASTILTKKTDAAPLEPLQAKKLNQEAENRTSLNLKNHIKELIADRRVRLGTYIVAGLLALVLILQVSKSIKKSNLAEKNKQTEALNKKTEESLKAINARAVKEKEQERKEQERREKEITESVKRRVSEINLEITLQEEELVLARQKFSEVTAVKIFRTAAERSEQVNEAMDQIKYHENEIELLKKEIKTVELNGQRAIEGRNY